MSKLLAASFLILVFSGLPLSAQKKVYDRGYDMKTPEAVIASKGTWSIGGNIGVTISSQNKYDFLIIDGITARSHSLLIAPQFCYMLADNIGIGGRIRYTRGYMAVDSASTSFGQTKIELKNYDYLRHTYLGGVFFRYYKPFGTSGRFSAYMDAEISAGGSTSTVFDKDGKGGYSQGLNVSLAGNAGLLALITAHFGVDVRVGLLEFGWSSLKQENNVGTAGAQQRKEASASSLGGCFFVDLTGISFGLHFYL